MKFSTIKRNRQVQEADSSGLTKTKLNLCSELIRLILLFAAGLKAHATTIRNDEIKTKADYKAYELQKTADPVLADIGRLPSQMALPFKANLAKYAIDEPEFRQMERLLEEFRMAIPKRRVAISISKVSTDNIDGVFRVQDKLIKEQLDALMEPFQFTQPDFYNAYKNARSIVDYAGRGKTVQAATVANPARWFCRFLLAALRVWQSE